MNSSNIDGEFNLKEILSFIIRNKKLIIKSTLITFLLSIIFAITQKKVWQGDFQIVLQQDNKSSKFSNIEGLSELVGNNNSSKSLETEIGILESPSILMNIYKYVKDIKLAQTNRKKYIRFNDWKDKFIKVKLEPQTSILSFSYKDNDKEIILPVLNKISSSYQDYSGRKRKRNIELGINFYEEQIEIFNVKRIESLREAQEFAIDQDLSILQDKALIDKEIVNSINIEEIRVTAANKIRQIDQQLKRINELEEDPEQIMYVASTIGSLKELSSKLKDIDSKVAKLKLTYKDQDKSIQDLEREKSFLINLLKRQVKGFLLASKENALSELKAAERPEGVLIKYRQLLNKTSKDSTTLDNLENQYRALQLEKARSEDPWELITTPTLLPNPVAPQKKKIVFIGTFIGIFIGSTIAFLIEKKSNNIFTTNELKRIWNYPILGILFYETIETLEESIEFLKQNQLSNNKKNIELFSLGKIEENLWNNIKDNFKKSFDNKNISFEEKLKKVTESKKYIFVAQIGYIKNEDIFYLQKKLKNLELDISLLILE